MSAGAWAVAAVIVAVLALVWWGLGWLGAGIVLLVVLLTLAAGAIEL